MLLDIETTHAVIAAMYHIVSLLVGATVVYLGYKLFTRDITPKTNHGAGDTTFKYGKYEFALKRGAPGTFFVIFGCAVIFMCLYKGIAFHSSTTTTTTPTQETARETGADATQDKRETTTTTTTTEMKKGMLEKEDTAKRR